MSEVLHVILSGRQDSNLRPPGPKPGALPACATSRALYWTAKLRLTSCPIKLIYCGEGGIRTRGTV